MGERNASRREHSPMLISVGGQLFIGAIFLELPFES